MDAAAARQQGIDSVSAGALLNARWRSATEHNVFADNRDEDIFGWIQPNEWDFVAGPNKTNFMRGECVTCAPDQDSCAVVPAPLQSCGGPSCGYGAPCCEYSRHATRTSGPSRPPPALLVQHDDDSSDPKTSSMSRIERLVKVEQSSSLGVSLIDIIHGRSCRPISLLDLRIFLHFQRQPQKRLPSYYPASDMQSLALNDVDLNVDLPTSTTAASPFTSASVQEKPSTPVSRRLHYDEVDALDFLVAYERYLTRFRDQPRADRLKSPDPATCKAAVRAYVQRACKTRASSDLAATDILLRSPDVADDLCDMPEEASREILGRLRPGDLGLKPESQPLRFEFDRLVHRYLCSRRVCIVSSSRKPWGNQNSGSSAETIADASDLPTQHRLGSSKDDKTPRLRWMVDVGLISEDELQLALAECDFSTHPDVLAPIAEAVYAYMSQHIVPFFFIAAARNLSPNTKRGRLLVGLCCTATALTFSILLIVSPSPLARRANNGTGEILRWWRLVTAPIWCAGLGYILAYFTGVCVWLTLRGNREPDEKEEREREEIRSRISGEDVVGFDLAELQAAADERDMAAEQDTNRWVAPEIAEILTGIAGQRKGKHRGQRSASSIRGSHDPRLLEEGRARSRSEVEHVPASVNISLEQTFADTSNATGSQASIEKNADLLVPAAVILHTPRKQAGMLGASDSAICPAAALSTSDLNSPVLVRPSLDCARKSLNDLGQADATVSTNGGNPAVHTLMRHKRVPLLNLSIGIVTRYGNELSEDHANAPVLTRDALLFDPELAARVTWPGFGEASAARSTNSGSPQGSPSAVTGRKLLTHALLPLKSNGRGCDAERKVPVRNRSGEINAEMGHTPLPKKPEPTARPPTPLDARDIAPWSALSAASSSDASSKPLLFSIPSSRRSHLSANTSTTLVGASSIVANAPKRAYEESSSGSFKARVWSAVQRASGFAVGTERVLDARVRRAQQMKALRIMVLNTFATVVVVAIVVAIP